MKGIFITMSSGMWPGVTGLVGTPHDDIEPCDDPKLLAERQSSDGVDDAKELVDSNEVKVVAVAASMSWISISLQGAVSIRNCIMNDFRLESTEWTQDIVTRRCCIPKEELLCYGDKKV